MMGMGCDVHMVAQAKDDAGAWQTLTFERPEMVTHWDVPEELVECERRLTKSVGLLYHFEKTQKAYAERDYLVFSVLADVRNFAGIPPVHPPRGLPDGFDAKGTPLELWSVDEHSSSWATLRELLDYDWEKVIPAGGLQTDSFWAEPERIPEPFKVREVLSTSFFALLGELMAFGAPEDVRLVYCFDN